MSAVSDIELRYIAADAIGALIRRLEGTQGLTLSDEARARLREDLRPAVEREVEQALAQEAEATR